MYGSQHLVGACLQVRRRDEEAGAVLQDLDGLVDHLVHDLCGRLDLVNDGGAFAEQMRPRPCTELVVVLALLDGILWGGYMKKRQLRSARGRAREKTWLASVRLRPRRVAMQPPLTVRDDTLVRQLADLVRLHLPALDVFGGAHAERTAGEDDGADVCLVRRRDDGLLVLAGRLRLDAGHEARADPDTVASVHQRGGKRLAAVDAAGGDGDDVSARQWALAAAAQVHDARAQDGERHVARVATTLATLVDDHVGAGVQHALDVLGVADDARHKDVVGVKLVHDPLGRDTNGRAAGTVKKERQHSVSGQYEKEGRSPALDAHEELGAKLNDDVDELRQLALCVVVVGLARVATDLGQQEIDAKGRVLVLEAVLEVLQLAAQDLGRVVDTTHHTEAAIVGHGRRQTGARGDVHARQHDGLGQPKLLRERCLDALLRHGWM